ncbi:MAG TPA: hypothetical protein PKI12_03105 [Bacteroidales bacterium]|nr:hypothetical protein [Bacteroidales bacterium]
MKRTLLTIAVVLGISAGITAQSSQTQNQNQTGTPGQNREQVQSQTTAQTGDQAQVQDRIRTRQQLQDGSCLQDPAGAQTKTRTAGARQGGSGTMARTRLQDPANCPNAMVRNNVRAGNGTGRR